MKRNGKSILLLLLVIPAVLFISSCATIRAVPRKGPVGNLMDLINSGNTEMIGKVTQIPMLIDGEIVSRKDDARTFWAQVNKAGFKLKTGENFVLKPLNPATHLFFGDTMEVKTFFNKYVPKTAITVEAEGTGGRYVFLLSGRTGKYPYIFGFTGPLK